jgi:hypothetical protein
MGVNEKMIWLGVASRSQRTQSISPFSTETSVALSGMDIA